jgi:26S proteasome regulatory subunit T1
MAPEPDDDIMHEKNPRPLNEDDIALIKTYVSAPQARLVPSPRRCSRRAGLVHG